MASMQCPRPCEQTNCQSHEKTYKSEACHDKNYTAAHKEHGFTDKMKEMVHSATQMFHGDDHPGHKDSNHNKNTNHCPTGAGHNGQGKTEHKMKKNEGHGGHCIPKVLHMKKKKNKEDHSDSGSSSSDSESDNEKPKNKC